MSGGVGISGHSMGGQATLQNSEADNAAAHGIVAAAMLHAYTHKLGPPACAAIPHIQLWPPFRTRLLPTM
jgi:hypothetical protein